MSNNQSSFQNENINVTLTREPSCRVHMDVTVTPLGVQASHQKAIKVINKEVSIPGFRKGKAPDAVILQKFSTHVEREWKDILLNMTFDEAIRLTKIYPFNEKSVSNATVKNASLKEGATLSYDYETFPIIPEINPQDLSIKEIKRHEVKEKDIEQAIEDLRIQGSEWIDITDRPVQEGDFVDIDIDAISEPARNICTNSRFGVSPDKMGTWMRKLVIGAKAGDVVEGMSEKEAEDDCQACENGEEHQHNHAEFVPTLCRITINGIKEAKLPTLDDELAKKYGATSLEDLKQKVTANLNKRADDGLKNEMRAQMEHALLNKYAFDLPYSIVQGQIKSRKKEIINDLRAQGTEEANIPTELKKIEEEMAKRIDNDFRLYFMIQKASREFNIEIPKEEVSMEWMRQMWYQQMGQNSIDTSKNPEEVQAQIHMQLLSAKTLDTLIEKAAK